jgi:outer membrane protein assembly factor BamE (lipoprotein component of BamABCDE complex)
MNHMRSFPVHLIVAVAIALSTLPIVGCDRNPFSGSKLTLANYNKITPGMSRGQVQEILGRPTSVETKDMIIFTKTTYRYEEGKNFAIITFKNDQVDSKDTNLTSG